MSHVIAPTIVRLGFASLPVGLLCPWFGSICGSPNVNRFPQNLHPRDPAVTAGAIDPRHPQPTLRRTSDAKRGGVAHLLEYWRSYHDERSSHCLLAGQNVLDPGRNDCAGLAVAALMKDAGAVGGLQVQLHDARAVGAGLGGESGGRINVA